MSEATHGVITLAAADLRTRPDHRSEMGSQLLMGEVVALEGPERGGWRRVRNLTDGYRGWVKRWAFVECGAVRAKRWRAMATVVVRTPIESLRAEPGSTTGLGPLFLGSRLIPGPSRGGRRRLELPDGRRGWVPSASLATRSQRPLALAARVRSLLGTPYLWGGRTPAGLDCSALVQLVLGERGVPMPRDAHHQWNACESLATGESPREGDLAFFATSPRARRSHVGICMGGKYFAHCRGLVRVQSLDPASPLFAAELAPQFRGWARPRSGGPPWPLSIGGSRLTRNPA